MTIDISGMTDRAAYTRYRFSDHTGATTITLTNADEWYNLTAELVPADPSPYREVGALYVPSDPIGDEAVYTQFQGPYRFSLEARVSGGTALQTTRLGLLIDGGGTFPVATLALVPEAQSDISIADANQLMHCTHLSEHVKPVLSAPIADVRGTKIQAVMSSTQAGEVITILSLELVVAHLAIALSGTSL